MKLKKLVEKLNDYLERYGDDVDVKLHICRNGKEFNWESVDDVTVNNEKGKPIIRIWS